MHTSLKTKVLIVGAGPVGLALSLELATHGVESIVVERNERGGLAPRAKTINVRSRELFRRWGIAERLAAESPFGIDYPSDVVFATRLSGQELVRFPNAFYCRPDQDPRFSEHAQWIPQYKVEKVLLERLNELPQAQVRFATELISFEQNANGVVAKLKPNSISNANGEEASEFLVEAQFIVGADGARSTVRRALGIEMEGVSPLSHHHNIVFKAPGLRDRHQLGNAAMYWIINSDAPATLSPMDADGRWAYGCTASPASNQAAAELICKSLGFDIDIEILNKDEWVAHRLIAKRYSMGRAYLAGDAAHLHPPYGGYGMNMGIGDAVDLGWKIASVLNGEGGPSLLDSYEIERRQVHERTIAEAVKNHASIAAKLPEPGIEDEGAQGDAIRKRVAAKIWDTKRREFDSLGVVLGSRYKTSNILPTAASSTASIPALTAEDDDALDYRPTAAPGCLAPHAWLRQGRDIGNSLYDHFSPDSHTLFVLDASAQKETEAFLQAARARGISLHTFAVDDPEIRALYKCRLALIRPDQFIAWCGDEVIDAESVLKVATGRSSDIATFETA